MLSRFPHLHVTRILHVFHHSEPINAPNNPTGWTITRREQKVILDHCRRLGIWIVADDAYDRLWFGEGNAAPAFLDIAERTIAWSPRTRFRSRD
jgi:bifunctional pyridoxal-dependent enzyme with beta-cystathionase and maltose regulon repressor activities